MGKRYHCLYCDAFVAPNPVAIRTHCGGLTHQSVRSEHYQRYKDAETILNEERNKRPCGRFSRGECMFGGLCRFSHYSREQIFQLEQIVAKKSKKAAESNKSEPSLQILYENLQTEKSSKNTVKDTGTTVYYDQYGQTAICPWSYPAQLEACQDDLPPSLKKIKLNDFVHDEFHDWG